jgi:hypothetical protein
MLTISNVKNLLKDSAGNSLVQELCQNYLNDRTLYWARNPHNPSVLLLMTYNSNSNLEHDLAAIEKLKGSEFSPYKTHYYCYFLGKSNVNITNIPYSYSLQEAKNKINNIMRERNYIVLNSRPKK